MWTCRIVTRLLAESLALVATTFAQTADPAAAPTRPAGHGAMGRRAVRGPGFGARRADAAHVRRALSHSFYWVWQYIFGVANRELVAADLLTDPCYPGRRFLGFLPAVYGLDGVQGRH